MPANTFLTGVLSGANTTTARIFEPQRSNNGLLTIDTIGKVPGMPADAPESIVLGLSGFTLPKSESGQTMIPYLNEVRKFAGRTNYDNISASFYDYIDRKTLSVLMQWRTAIYNPLYGTHGLKSQYACSGYIKMFAPNGDNTQSIGYKLEGIFPLGVDPGNIDFGSDEPVRISVNFSIDKAIPDFGDSAGGLHMTGINEPQF